MRGRRNCHLYIFRGLGMREIEDFRIIMLLTKLNGKAIPLK